MYHVPEYIHIDQMEIYNIVCFVDEPLHCIILHDIVACGKTLSYYIINYHNMRRPMLV